MGQRDTGIQRNSVLRQCTIVAFVLALALAVCGVWAVYTFAEHEQNYQLNNDQYAPALAAFDANRGALSVQDVRVVDSTKDCLTTDGWEAVTPLVTWRGTSAGCAVGTTVTSGACTAANANGVPVAANPTFATPLLVWETWQDAATTPPDTPKKYCLQRVKSAVFKDTTTTCATGQTPCGCHCVTMNELTDGTTGDAVVPQRECPLSGYKYVAATTATAPTDGTGWVNEYKWTDGVNVPAAATTATQEWFAWYTTSKSTTQLPEMINLEVGYYADKPDIAACVNPLNFPVDPATQYSLMASKYTGCGALGADDSTQVVATMNEWAFYRANAQDAALDTAEPTYKTLTAGADFTVSLLNRQKIVAACTATCDAFRFNPLATSLLTQYGQIWDEVRLLGVVSMSCAVVALCMLVLIYIEGVRRQTQNYMTVLYAFCIVGLFLSVIYVYQASDNAKAYTLAAAPITTAVSDACFTGAWGTLLSSWATRTSLGALNSQLQWVLYVCVILLVGGVVFAIVALMKLAKRRSQVGNYHTDNN